MIPVERKLSLSEPKMGTIYMWTLLLTTICAIMKRQQTWFCFTAGGCISPPVVVFQHSAVNLSTGGCVSRGSAAPTQEICLSRSAVEFVFRGGQTPWMAEMVRILDALWHLGVWVPKPSDVGDRREKLEATRKMWIHCEHIAQHAGLWQVCLKHFHF